MGCLEPGVGACHARYMRRFRTVLLNSADLLLVTFAAGVWYRHAYEVPQPQWVLWLCMALAAYGLAGLAHTILTLVRRRPHA
jgi:hypothetical protein